MRAVAAGAFILAVTLAVAHGAERDIVGTWEVKEFSIQNLQTKETARPFGDSLAGYLQYSPGGHMVVFLSSGKLLPPKDKTYTDADRAAIHQGIIGAYSGKYRVEGNKVVHHILASWRPEWIGTEQTRFFEVDGNTLKIQTVPQPAMTGTGERVITLKLLRVE